MKGLYNMGPIIYSSVVEAVWGVSFFWGRDDPFKVSDIFKIWNQTLLSIFSMHINTKQILNCSINHYKNIISLQTGQVLIFWSHRSMQTCKYYSMNMNFKKFIYPVVLMVTVKYDEPVSQFVQTNQTHILK